jgi:hypothetical protein
VDGARPQARQLAATLPLHAPRGGHGHQSDPSLSKREPKECGLGGPWIFSGPPT